MTTLNYRSRYRYSLASLAAQFRNNLMLRCARFDGHSNCLILSDRIERRRSVSCRGRRVYGPVGSTMKS